MSGSALAPLQKMDSRTDAIRQRLNELERLRADSRELAQRETEAQGARAALEKSRGQLRDRELELKSLETRIADIEQRLYGGRIRNPKELEGLEKEARMFKLSRDKLEESVLNLMEAAEQAERAAQAAQAQLEQAQRVRQQSEQAWRQEEEQLRAESSALQASRDALRATLDADPLETYDRLRRRSPIAVAPVRGHLCGACGIQLTSDVYQRAQDESALAQCENCRRILYVE